MKMKILEFTKNQLTTSYIPSKHKWKLTNSLVKKIEKMIKLVKFT